MLPTYLAVLHSMSWSSLQLRNHPKFTKLTGVSALAPKTDTPQKSALAPKWKSGWYQIGDKKCYFRSRWEAVYADYLEILRKGGAITSWEYEPTTFWFEGIKRGTNSYKPDFKVTMPDGMHEWHEIKGWMDPRSATKLKRMAKYHPTEKILVRDAAWFRGNNALKSIK